MSRKTPPPDTLNLVLAGVGGQGVLLTSRLLCHVAVKAGLEVQALEEHGMAQRGGAVTTQLRLGREPIPTSEIRPGTGNVLLAFEPLEALRALPLMDLAATLVINGRQLSPQALPPPGGGKAPRSTALDLEQARRLIGERFSRVHLFDATTLAERAGSTLAVNMVLLGSLAHLETLPPEMDRQALERAIKDQTAESFRATNLEAFRSGYEAMGGQD